MFEVLIKYCHAPFSILCHLQYQSMYSIVNNTMHELYFDQVAIFWIKYNEVPAKLYLIQNITTWSKYNECTYYLF